MSSDARLVRISRLMSVILRHEPERFGVLLDAEGYTPLDELLVAVRKRYPNVSEADLRAVVETVEPAKQRYSIVDGHIRANYGHSLEGRILHAGAPPPDFLYHGTAQHVLDTILAQGIRPMARQYVHLTEDRALALRVGARRGTPRLIEVDARRAHAEGVVFYRANRSFWLADKVPPRYLSA